jgi:Methyltransferase domain
MTNRVAEIVKMPARAINSRLRSWRLTRFYKSLSVKDAFAEIYNSGFWGTREGARFCSGEGSSREDLVNPYCAEVEKFIDSHHIQNLVDLGCGDFNVGSRLRTHVGTYTGVDVVPALIEYNQKQFGDKDVAFKCLNIIDDDLPEGDLCLIRQVLQHLSNAQIELVLPKLARYEFVIVTEHVYEGPGFKPNMDKPQGPGTRIPRQSGVYLDAPPFNKTATLLRMIPVTTNEILRMVILEGRPH